MTQALYRRYRPDTFTEVIGQEHVTEPLMQALRANKVSHAYLFSGPRGCGKTTSARILARCLNCAQGPTPEPCGECESCVELARGGAGSLDVVEIDAASHGGVDDARDLRERATFAPARDRYKVFILDEAHMVTSQGFNALLKIVEEPPPHIKFIFATTEPDKVIGTIRSRTHHYPFRLVAPATLLPYLEQICATEHVPVGSGVLPLVVRAGGGSVRDSLSVLDQLVAGADDAGIDYERAVALLGYTHAALLDDAVDAIAARDGASAFRVVERVVSSGHEPRRFVEDLLERLRDLIVIAASGEAAAAVLRDLPADQLERMRAQASTLGSAELSRSADLANTALTEMTGATSPRLHLELLVARLLLPAADDGATGLAARLDRVERELGSGARSGSGAQGGSGAGAGAGAVPEAPGPSEEPVRVAQVRRAPEPATEPEVEVEAEPVSQAAPVPSSEPEGPAGPAASAVPDRPDRGTAQPAGGPVVDGGVEAETVRRRWPEVLDTLRGLRMATWVLVSQNAQVTQVAQGAVTLGFTTPQLATTFRTGSHAEHVQRALRETLGLDTRVETGLAVSADRAHGRGADGRGEDGPTSPDLGHGDDRGHGPDGDRDRGPADGQVRASGRGPEREHARADGPRADGGRSGDGRSGDGPGSGRVSGGSTPTDRGTGGGFRSDAARRARASWDEPADHDLPEAGPDQPSDLDPYPGPDQPPGPDSLPASDSHPSAEAPARRAGPADGLRTGAPGRSQGRGGAQRPPAETDRPRDVGNRPTASASPERPVAVDDGEDAAPDDPDLNASGLVGAPLVAQMLGGTVIDEIPDPPV